MNQKKLNGACKHCERSIPTNVKDTLTHPIKHLALIRNCIQIVKNLRGIDIDLNKIPVDDELTFRLICDADTDGVFIFEEVDARCYMKYLQPRGFNDLVVFNALYQPVLMDYLPEFIERVHGKTIQYDLPIMEKYLNNSVGLLAFQEQLVLLSRLLAGFSRKQSYDLLQAFQDNQQEKFFDSFLEGGRRAGYQTKVLEEIWNNWGRIAKFLQSKSHITSQTWITYQTAYLKAHYPGEFKMCMREANNK